MFSIPFLRKKPGQGYMLMYVLQLQLPFARWGSNRPMRPAVYNLRDGLAASDNDLLVAHNCNMLHRALQGRW